MEDEMHFFIFSCERNQLFKSIEKSCKNFKDVPEETLFIPGKKSCSLMLLASIK